MRWLVGVGLVVAMLAFGIGVYHAAELFRANKPVVHKPNEVSVEALPGTMYVAQQGALYKFHHGNFTQITPEAGWLQPSVDPRGGQLVAVQRKNNFSDLYLLSTSGHVTAQLTHNQSDVVETSHWSFYPRFSPDGSQLFYAYDPKDSYNSYQIDLAIFASPSNPGSRSPVQWTSPNAYTGGDVDPQSLRDGGLVYVKYSIDDQFQVHSQVWYQRRAGTDGVALTSADLNCAQAALSADEKHIAMVCRKSSNTNNEVDVAPFDPTTGQVGATTTLVTGVLAASPAFSPDGKTVAFLAPAKAGGGFQLWSAPASGSSAAHQVTFDLGLDADSAPVWVG